MNETILLRYIKGETAPEEELEVARWMEENPEKHQRELDEVRFIYHFSLLNDERTARRPEASARPAALRPWRRIGRYALRAAAAAVLLIVGGYTAKLHIYNEIGRQSTIFEVPYGQRVRIALPDGSNVWLNSGARIEYPPVFSRNDRRVKLTGEALFEVEHDSERPFRIETFASEISVLGTKFNVVADETHRRFSTTLLEGRVRLTNRVDPTQPDIVLSPNDMATLSNGRMYVRTETDPEALCWTEGLVSIGGLPFDELMARFEQVFDVKIVLARETLPRIGRISGKIRVNDGIENALHILQYAADFRYERDAETNVVTIR